MDGFELLTPLEGLTSGAVCGIDGVCRVPGEDGDARADASAGADADVADAPAGAVVDRATGVAGVAGAAGMAGAAAAVGGLGAAGAGDGLGAAGAEASGSHARGLGPLVGTREIDSAADMEQLGVQMGRMLHAGDLVVLAGALGAGKTTLTRGIGQGLGVRGPIQSPTFVIARTHPSLVGGAPLVHADAYRLGSAMELDDLDIDADGSVVVVEWGRGMAEGLRDVWWEVDIAREAGGSGADSACAMPGWDPEDQDHPDPRIVTITRRP